MVYENKFFQVVFVFLAAAVLLNCSQIFAQRIVDKNKGDDNHTQKGFMNGNLVETVYYNFGEIADWENEPSRSGVWPKGTNHTYIDGVAIIVQAETKDPSGRTIHPLESNYYEFTRYDPSTGVTYGWWPLPGYAKPKPFNTAPARSDEPSTWPDHWPDRPSDWDNSWNGFFGKGVQNADLETFFVFDDNEDREYILNNNFHSDADDPTRGGLGMQVRARGFQWSQVLAEDVIFWYYEITNMGTTDYNKTLFAQYIDWGIGGHDNSSNNAGDYNEFLDMSYSWSTVPFGSPGNWSPVGLSGYAFLESPGIPDDRRDNDNDGLSDEKRDNLPNNFINSSDQDAFLLDPFQDTIAFKEFYGYSWKPHWDADENCNWRSFLDIDSNGVADEGESLNDDLGADGIGPFDEGYTEPDLDGTEGNGRPDQGEPNFGILDKDESDQLGLTGFAIYAVHKYELDNDEENWTVLSGLPEPHGKKLEGVNLANYFSCYLFSMEGRNTYSSSTGTLQETGETERFSMGLIFGIDQDDLFRRKRTVQQIYNANYRFAKPPDKPFIKAIPGDEQVTLYWDNRAELTYDAFFQKFNFEGYRIYRATEPNFLEDKVVTDAYGKPIFRKPIAQFDLADGIKGLHPIDVNGAKFDLGNDTGLKHSFIDTDVQNGQTYYYAVVAYDQGFTSTDIEGNFEGIPPSETTSILNRDINGNISNDVNTAVVTPRTPGAGYIAPEISNYSASGPASGNVSINILDPSLIENFHTYRIEFRDSSAYHNNPRPYYQIIDYSENDTIVSLTRLKGNQEATQVIEGFAVDITNDTLVTIDRNRTQWISGSSNYIMQVGFSDEYSANKTLRADYPADFEIHFKEPLQGDSSFPTGSFDRPILSNIQIKNITENIEHFQFKFYDEDDNGLFTNGDAIYVVFGDSAAKRATNFKNLHVSWSVLIIKDTTLAEDEQDPPQPGDVFRIATTKPFRTGEYVEFTTKAPAFDLNKAQGDLNNVAVVPNPYTGAASWEPATTDVGRGERRIFFINLPMSCKIRIYTISGKFVDEIIHESTIDNGQESWDLVSKDGMDIAYGVYIYHIEAPGLGEKIDKFAVIK